MWPALISLGGVLATVAKAILPSAQDITKVVFGDQTARDASNAEADKAAQESFGKEFSYPLGEHRSRFDIFMDAVNRLPRPTITFALLGMFTWTCLDPPAATRAFTALALIPEMLWNIALLVVGFFFTSRMIEKMQWNKYRAPSKAQIEQAREIVAQRREAPEEQPIVEQASMLGIASAVKDDLLTLAGYGPGQLTTRGYTGQLPPSRGAGWRNPIASRYSLEEDSAHVSG